jgi:hypothetical protein
MGSAMATDWPSLFVDRHLTAARHPSAKHGADDGGKLSAYASSASTTHGICYGKFTATSRLKNGEFKHEVQL